jgi:TonB family protein
MNKIIIIFIAVFFGVQINSFAQNIDENIKEITHQELVDQLAVAYGDETYLKDFPINLKPGEEVRYSVSLNKRTKYGWYTNIPNHNQLDIKLYSSHNNIIYNNKASDIGIIDFSIKCNKDVVYQLSARNISNKPVKTAVLLTFAGRFNPKKEFTSDPILDQINAASKGTYLKDFQINLEPNSEARHSLVLSKYIKYSFSFYQNEPNQFEVKLLENKTKKPVTPSSIEVNDKIRSSEYTINETGVYLLFVKNNSTKQAKTVTVLSFIERIDESENAETIVNTQPEYKDVTDVYFTVEKMPKFKDKENKIKDFNNYVEKEMQYPQEALNENIEGKVYVQFTVSKDGYLKDAKVVRGSHPALDQEALRIVYSSPKWEPGTQKGKAVDVIFTFPIIFYIKNK